jgi:hypothetical protein
MAGFSKSKVDGTTTYCVILRKSTDYFERDLKIVELDQSFNLQYERFFSEYN